MTDPNLHGFRVSGPQAFNISEDLRRINAASVLRCVLLDGPLARAEIADRLGLTRATITRVSGQLLESGLLVEGKPRRSNLGRPLVPLELGGSERLALTVHIGGVETRVGLVNIRGEVVVERRYPYEGTSPQEVSEVIARGVDAVSAELPAGGQLLGMSASIGGWVDPGGEFIVNYRPLDWAAVPLESLLPSIGLPRYVDQLVRGLALAERMFGAAGTTTDFLELWSGNVLGAALFENGSVRRGPRGGAGGIDHFPTTLVGDRCWCGRTDCLQSVVTDHAIVAEARRLGLLRAEGSLRTLIEMVRDGDAAARSLIHERAAELGRASAVMVDLTGPSSVVLAGLTTTTPGFQDAFEKAFRSTTEQAALTPVLLSSFGDLAPTVASAASLLDAFFNDPLAFERRQTV
jgi:predicted NBD/HSP70 family sugar kinase